MKSYRKLPILRDIWEHPENYEPTPCEKVVIQKLESFIQQVQAYNGKIICGDHGVGKTFTVRYFLSKIKCLDDKHYIHVNRTVLEEIGRRKISIKQKGELLRVIKSLLKNVEPVLVLDACEVLSLLEPSQRMEFIRDVRYRKTKTILVLPTELDPRIPSITIKFPNLTHEDYKIFFRNLKIKMEVPSFPTSFTELIRRVI